MNDRKHRKELIQEYKAKEPAAGVYWIRNKVSGKVLLGSSLNLQGRLNRHQAQLEFGSHSSRSLQQDWRELGPGAFELAIVETVENKLTPDFNVEVELKKLEVKWIEKMRPFSQNCYNGTEQIRTQTF